MRLQHDAATLWKLSDKYIALSFASALCACCVCIGSFICLSAQPSPLPGMTLFCQVGAVLSPGILKSILTNINSC